MGVKFHHPYEFTKKVLGVVRAWGGLWVILHGKDGQVLMPHPFKRPVIEVYLCEFDLLRIERIWVNTESVVLGGDHHPAGLEILDGLIGSAVAEF